MYWLFTGLLCFAQLICLGLIWASCFPGMLDLFTFIGILFLFGSVTIFASLGLLLIGAVVRFLIRKKHRSQLPIWARLLPQPPSRRYPKQWAIATGMVILLTLVLIRFNLPQIVAFSFSRPAFETFVANTEQVKRLCADRYVAPPVSQQLGVYPVLMCHQDLRGGIYLKTYTGGFFSTENYGFAYQPNPEGSERFGRVGQDGYEYGHLMGDWYWFMGVRDTF